MSNVRGRYTGPLRKIDPLDYIQWDLTPNLPPDETTEGLSYWNSTDKTLNLVSGIGPVLQVGQEIWMLVRNETGSQIDDGKAIFINGASTGRPTISMAKADIPTTADRTIGFTTMDIPTDTEGIVTIFGKVRGIDTSGCAAGDQIYLSADTAGEFANVQPTYPNYIIKMGNCIISDGSDGEIAVNVIGRIEDILENAWNGGFLETVNFTVASNGTTITGTLENDDNTKDLTMNFSTGFEVLDTTTSPVTVPITAGPDDNPQKNFIYIPISTKTLTASTSEWPTEQHIKVADVCVRTANTTLTDGALCNRNWNDHIAASSNSQGHIQEMAEKLRQFEAQWDSGAEGSLTIVTQGGAADDLFAAATSGKVYQLHRQTFPALDMATGDDIHVVNDSVSPYKTIANLNSELTDASGVSLSNRYYSLVLWGVINRSGETSHIMVNLPISSYNSSALAQSDPSNFSVYDIPATFQGLGFLIARFTVKHSPANSGTWTLEATQDLRGFLPNTTAGGGAGGGGVSTFAGLTDTPNSYVSQALKIAQVNAGETALEYTSTPTLTATNFTGVSGITGLGTQVQDLNMGTFDITGTDLDISAGTGDYTGTGLIRLKTNTAVSDTAPFASDIEFLSDDTHTHAKQSGISIVPFYPINSSTLGIGGYFSARTEGAQTSSQQIFGLHGGAIATITSTGAASSGGIFYGLDFAVSQSGAFDLAGGFNNSTFDFRGASVLSTMGSAGNTIDGTGTNSFSNCGGVFRTQLLGTISTPTAFNCGLKIENTSSSFIVDSGTTLDSYALHFSNAATATETGTFNKWGLFGESDVNNAINGKLRIGSTTAPTNALDVTGTVDATAYDVGGTAGASFSGAVTNITVVNGIVTAAS